MSDTVIKYNIFINNIKQISVKETNALQAIGVNQINSRCTTITFEGGQDNAPITDINVGFTTVQFPGWLTIIDSDDGGSGNFANEPSPITTAYWLSQEGFDDSYREIIFTNPVCQVEVFYASSVPVTLNAYDENNILVGSVNGNINVGTGGGGDPTGNFDKFDPLAINLTSNVIKRIRIIALANQIGIDDLTICRCARGLLVEI